MNTTDCVRCHLPREQSALVQRTSGLCRWYRFVHCILSEIDPRIKLVRKKPSSFKMDNSLDLTRAALKLKPSELFKGSCSNSDTYDLISIVRTSVKVGGNRGGHYTSTVSLDDGKSWWFCDDTSVVYLGGSIDEIRSKTDKMTVRLLVYKRRAE